MPNPPSSHFHRRLRGAVAARLNDAFGLGLDDIPAQPAKRGEDLLFLRRWLANPLKVGSVLPSSPALARLVAKNVKVGEDQAVLELGAGTGAVTRALRASGIQNDRLFVVEIDGRMAAFLRKQFASLQVIHGDATNLSQLLPVAWHGRIGTVICGIPMVNLPLSVQKRIVDACFSVLAPDGRLLQFTYLPVSPLPKGRLGLTGKRMGTTILNLPPASVWSYKRVEPEAA
ncbi:MAG: methyltransferase domain-containing protein [Rhodospirillaceae bacterium]|nr:methyltransferase domain-containing protein [Rhodospirillaceae bacterium]